MHLPDNSTSSSENDSAGEKQSESTNESEQSDGTCETYEMSDNHESNLRSLGFEELVLRCQFLERTNELLEERISDLEEKNGDLAQANVLLLRENDMFKNETERLKKEFLIKLTAARLEYNNFVQDIKNQLSRMKELKEMMGQMELGMEQTLERHDPLYIFDHRFEQSLSLDELENLNSTRLKSLRSTGDMNIHRPRLEKRNERQTNLSVLEEEQRLESSTPRRYLDTPSFRRINPKTPRVTPDGRICSPITDSLANWQYESPTPSALAIEPRLSESLDSIQNFEPKSVHFEESCRQRSEEPPSKKARSKVNRESRVFEEKTPSPLRPMSTNTGVDVASINRSRSFEDEEYDELKVRRSKRKRKPVHYK